MGLLSVFCSQALRWFPCANMVCHGLLTLGAMWGLGGWLPAPRSKLSALVQVKRPWSSGPHRRGWACDLGLDTWMPARTLHTHSCVAWVSHFPSAEEGWQVLLWKLL